MNDWEVLPDPNVLAAQKSAEEAVAAAKLAQDRYDAAIASIKHLEAVVEFQQQILGAFKETSEALRTVVAELQRPRRMKVTKRSKAGEIMEAETSPI